jgi:hypothetical protein
VFTVTCLAEHVVRLNDNCDSIKADKRLTDVRFRQLNPNVNCDSLSLNQRVCIKDERTGCLRFEFLPDAHSETCDSFANRFSLSVHTLRSINNWFDCAQISQIKVLCSSALSPECSEIYRVEPSNTLATILSRFSIEESSFYKANPFLNPNQLNEGQFVCLKQAKNDAEMFATDSKTIQFANTVNAFGDLNSLYQQYLTNPSKQNAEVYQNEIINMLETSSQMRQAIKEFEDTQAQEDLRNNGLNSLCDLTSNSPDYPLTKTCACANIEPKSYCGLLFVQETEALNSQYVNTLFNLEFWFKKYFSIFT